MQQNVPIFWAFITKILKIEPITIKYTLLQVFEGFFSNVCKVHDFVIHLFIKQKLCFSVVLAYLCPCSVYKECTRWLNYSIVKVLLRCFLFGSPQYSVLGLRGFIPSLVRTKWPQKLTCFPSNTKNKYKFSEFAQRNRRIWLLNAAKCACILGFYYKVMENRTDYYQIRTFANF